MKLADYDQRELEMLELALQNLTETDYLPQHAARMDNTVCRLLSEVRELQRATSNSRDGSWFGECYADEIRLENGAIVPADEDRQPQTNYCHVSNPDGI